LHIPKKYSNFALQFGTTYKTFGLFAEQMVIDHQKKLFMVCVCFKGILNWDWACHVFPLSLMTS